MKEESKSTVESLVYLLVLLVLLVPASMWNGFVVSKLWEWFVVPIGIAPIGMVGAMGIFLIVSSVRGFRHRHDERSVEDKIIASIFTATFAPAIALGLGALYKTFL